MAEINTPPFFGYTPQSQQFNNNNSYATFR